jgi:tRNA nucleotidyltransferase/poly(A) polymerase
VYTKVSGIKNHRLYPEFAKIKERLKSNQFICWLAGGAVRDMLLGTELSDFDIVCDASTETLKILFPEAVLVGEAFGVLKIPVGGGETIDLATFREEADYKDGRRPSMVRSSTPVQDALRRDFTVNSFFWDDENQKVWDFEGGLSDLELKILRCVGDAGTRFEEDYLRIVRLMRFSLQLGFSIESKTLQAAREGLSRVEKVSGERIWAELKKIETHGAWLNASRSEFFKEVVSFIFKDNQIKPGVLSKLNPGASLLIAIYLLNPSQDYSDLLKSRLKISKRELEKYRNIRFLAEELVKLQLEEMIFELEQSEERFSDFREMVLAGVIEEKLLANVEKLRAEHPAVLVSGSEMKDLVPPRQISEEIRKIRVGQLGKIFKTKVDALDYLKKKYA